MWTSIVKALTSIVKTLTSIVHLHRFKMASVRRDAIYFLDADDADDADKLWDSPKIQLQIIPSLCHSERSEESEYVSIIVFCLRLQILHCVQNDRDIMYTIYNRLFGLTLNYNRSGINLKY